MKILAMNAATNIRIARTHPGPPAVRQLPAMPAFGFILPSPFAFYLLTFRRFVSPFAFAFLPINFGSVPVAFYPDADCNIVIPPIATL